MRKIIRATTVPQSLVFFEGTMPELLKDYDVQLLSSPGEELLKEGEKFGVKTHAVEMFRRLSPLKDLGSLRKLIKVFRKEKPYMVHSMTPKAGLLCMIAAWWTKVPIRVHTFTGLVWPTEKGFKRRLLMLTDKITCACATHIIPEGEGVKSDLINGSITKKPIRVLGYGNVKGVDMKYFSRRPEVMEKAAVIRDDSLYTFLFVGRVVREKGINELCEAFEKVQNQFSNVRLFLVGKFEDDIDPISKKSKTIVDQNTSIVALGPQYGDDLLAYYAASDCFVFPSYREGFPNTVLEAGAMGLPSIVTDINGSREIIVDGKNGLIIPSKDVDSLYNAMIQLRTDIKMNEKLSKNSREMISSRFDKEYVQGCLLGFYQNVLGK